MSMKKYIIISIIFGFALGYLTFLGFDEISQNSNNKEFVMNHSDHGMDMLHSHELLEVNHELIPGLTVNVYPDEKSGFNVQLLTENFEFTPETVNRENIQNQGHAHIYINDQKIARVYSSWFHINDHHINNDMNMMRVTLNANDHSEWSINNEPIEVRMNLK